MQTPINKYQFKYDNSVDCRLLSVWDFPSRSEDWSNIKQRETKKIKNKSLIRLDLVDSELNDLFEKIEEPETADKLITARKWIPESLDAPFGVFIDTKQLSKKEIKKFKKSCLCHGFYGSIAILSRGERPWSYYKRCIDFYERFDHLVISEEAEESIPYLIYQIPSNEAANKTYLFFSDTDGTGILIKNMEDQEYSGAGGAVDREIEVITIGSFLRADVPGNAVILEEKKGDEVIFQFGEGSHVFLECLTPNSKPLHKGTELDFKRIAEESPEYLGRMLVFDTIAGSWDRHTGNYLIHNLEEDQSRSLQEIDFGLFDPGYFKAANWQGREDEFLPSRYASIRGSQPGWDITRHPMVTKIIQQANKEQVLAGIQQALFQLQLGFRTKFFESNLSTVFYKRIEAFFDMKSPLRFAFETDLATLDLFDPGWVVI
ncbi:MAG: hypothetical protein ACXAC7_11285 [Candidatus Hodarchaeales archaeon]